MKSFLKTKLGLVCVAVFAVAMALVFHRVSARHNAPLPPSTRSDVAVKTTLPPATTSAMPASPNGSPTANTSAVAENAAYLDQYYDLEHRTREEHDRQGNPVTHRENARTPTDAGRVTADDEPPTSSSNLQRVSSRLQGKPSPTVSASSSTVSSPIGFVQNKLEQLTRVPTFGNPAEKPTLSSAIEPMHARPKRFNPFGRVIKCELVFAIDSTNEETPLVAIVMEPVYNNGALIIPAGAEFHGVVRADRLRDRLFSGTDWVLVFPRDRDRPNGRQLNVRGIALDRVEPDVNGMTWGITDGSCGLQGEIIRTLQNEEIKRFAATFLSAATVALENREVGRDGHETVRNTPQNAMLQGLSVNLQRIAEDITAEIERHGVFIRVPAGHQFYFYPTQIIDPDVADISADIANVK